MRKRTSTLFFASAWLSLMVISVNTGCSFDNEEEYYANLMCDTANVTYSGSVAPIFAASCTSCHSVSGATFPDLGTYETVKSYIESDTGAIPARIRHIVGYTPMPQGAPKLPECDIRKIEIWIEAGFPNN